MATQSPVNFFTLNANKNSVPWYNAFNDTQSGVQNNMMEQNIAPSVKTADLDEQLRTEGLKIESPMTQEAKQSYVDSLSEEQYGKMLNYKNAWYSFEASKALLKAEEQVTWWWYRGEGFQNQEPIGGSFLNSLNPMWLLFEKIDDYIQEHVTDYDDWDDESYSFLTTLKNIPGSALKTASAIGRWLSNPVDTMVMLVQLLGTSEGRDIIKQRYGSWDWILNTLEKDPVWLASDVLTIVQWWASIAGTAGKLWATGAKLAGKASTASKLASFWTKASKLGNTAGILADLWISIPYNNLLDSTLTKLSNGGKLSQRAGQYLSMTQRPIQTIFKGANPASAWGLSSPGIQDKVSSIIARAKENISSTATGLTQEVKDRIRNNPYVWEYRKQTEERINTEGASLEPQKLIEEPLQELGNELLKRLDDYEKRLEENWPAYQRLKATTQPHDLAAAFSSTLDVFSKNQISLTPDGTLRFANMILPSDMNPITTAWQLINKAPWWQMTVRDYLNLRSQLTDLAKFESGTTTKGTKVIKELRNQINKVAHKEIPGLEKVDWLYSKQTKELQELRKGLVYQQGSRKGETRDNFYSIIKNMNTANRGQMRKRLSNIFPDLEARAEAINMLPKLANAYQNSPQMMKTMFKATGALAGLGSNAWAIRTAMGYIVGLVLDEFLWKPLGEKWRKLAIDKLLQETTPEAQQLLAEVASKVKAGIDLTANERATLEQAISEIIGSENEYLDGQRLEEWERENNKLRLPEPKPDVAWENGIKLWEGRALRQPEPYNLKKERTTEVNEIKEELNVDEGTATKVSDSIEDFLDEVWAYDGQLNPREVNYSKFSTKSLNELYESDLPRTEKSKIEKELEQRQGEESISNDEPYYAYKIRQLEEEEQRIGKIGKNKVSKAVADQQSRNLVEKRERLIKELEQVYFDGDPDSANKAAEKYVELRDKPLSFIEQYTKSSRFPEEQAERIILDRLMNEWNQQPKFTRQLSEEGINKRNELLNTELNNGYKFDTNEYNDRYIKEENWQIVDRGSIKYDENGKIEVIAQNIDWLLESGLLTRLPEDAVIKISWENESFTAGELVWDWQYQKAWVADPNERTISAEEWLSIRNFKNWRSVREIMKDYGVSEEIVDKIVTEKGEQALWRYKDQLIELASLIKEGTAPHELFHAVFDLVDNWRKEEILKIVQERKWMSRNEANEWLADRFSEYFRTGKFDTKTAPKWLLGRIRAFFDKVRDFVTWVYREKAKVKQLFDDILDNKIETDIERDMVSEILYNKNEVPVQPQREGPQGTSSTNSLTIDKNNSSQFKNKFDEVKEQIRTGEVTKDNFLDAIKEVIKNSDEESEYVTNKNTDEVHTLRVSDHHAKSWHAYRQGHPDNNTSVVIKMFSETRWWPRNKRDAFQKNKHVDMKEFAYDIEKLTPEKMESIIDSINNWIDNGEWSDKNYNKFKESVKRDPEAEYQITQESLFTEPKKTAQDYDKIVDKISWEMSVYNMRKNYDSKPRVWMWNIIESTWKDRAGRGANDFIQLYQDYKRLEDLSKDERLMNYLEMYDENTKQGELYKMLKQIKDEPVDFSKTIVDWRTPDELDYMKQVLDIDSYARDKLAESYDPDVIERHSNISGERGLRWMSLEKLRKLKEAGQKLLDQWQDEIKSWFYMEPENNLLKSIKERKNSNMFEKKSVNKVADRAYDILKAVVRDVEMMNDNYDLMNWEWKEWYESYPRDIFINTIIDLAKSYNPDVDKWQENLWKELKETISKFKWFEWVKRFKTLVWKPKLTELKSYIERLKDANPELIKDPDVKDFVSLVQEKNAELEAKWANTALRKLVAQSLMTLENFEKQVKNFEGKSPMPSIAVMDKNIPHTWNSDATIDLVFWKDTVDPKADPRNKIYGSDAWTPTFPSTTLKEKPLTIDEWISYAEKLIDKFWAKEIFPHWAIWDWGWLAWSTEWLRDYFAWWIGRKMRTEINRWNTENLKYNIWNIVRSAMMDYYKKSWLPERKWDSKFSYDQVVESVSDIADEMKEKYTWEEVIPASYFPSQQKTSLTEIERENLADKITERLMLDPDMQWLWEEDVREDVSTIVNNNHTGWTDSILDILWENYDINLNEFRLIIDEFYGTESADRPYNAQNALEAMLNQRRNREVTEWSFEDMAKIKGSEIEDIEEVRGKNYFRWWHNELAYDTKWLERRYNDLVRILAEENDWLDWNSVDDGNVMDDIKYAIKKAYDPDPAKFKEQLIKASKEEWFVGDLKYDEEVLKRMIDVIEKGRKSPVRYTESKPERIVDLYNEVQAVLAPTEDRAKVEAIVKGTPLEWKVTYYNNQDMDNPRQRKLDELQKKYWNVFFSMAGTIMPITMLLQAINNIQWDDEGTE